MRSELDLLRSNIEKNKNIELFNQENNIINNQSTLKDYEKNNEIKIIIDHREYRSKVVRNLMELGISIESQQLNVGDYILSTRIGVERKKVDDFLNSLINGKLFTQISKLRDAYSRPMLIIEGEGLFTKRNIKHNAIFGSLVSIMIDYGIPDGDSSMSRTVGLPAAIGVRMILDGTITDRGVLIPIKKSIYEPILKELEEMNITFIEKLEREL